MKELIVKVYRGQPEMELIDENGERHIVEPKLVNQIHESPTGITEDPAGALVTAIQKAVQEARIANKQEPLQDGGMTPPAND